MNTTCTMLAASLHKGILPPKKELPKRTTKAKKAIQTYFNPLIRINRTLFNLNNFNLFNLSYRLLLSLLLTTGISLESRGQVLPSDSLEVLSLYQNHCPHCPWRDINSPKYWNLSQPMNTWYGVGISGNRVDSLELRLNGVIGILPNLNLPELKQLHIGNIVPSVAGFDHLQQLETLNLDSRGLNQIPALDSLKNLKKLILKDALVTQLPDLNFSHRLNYLSFQNLNHIAALPELDSCGSLTFLEVKSCPNITVTDLSPCGQLESLRIESCGLDSLPSLLNCPLLTELSLTDNQLQSLPNLSHLTQLNHLDLTANQLSFYFLEPFSGIGNFSWLPQTNIPVSGTDTLLLLASQPGNAPSHIRGGTGTQVNWYKNGNLVSISDSIPNAGTGLYQVFLTHSQLAGTLVTRPVYLFLDDEPVVCGNTNQDGRIDMQDLAALGLYYGASGSPRDSFGQNPAPAWPWNQNSGLAMDYALAGDTVNMKHADCNGDGLLNELDISCIDQHYQPMQLNQFLSSSVQDSIKLVAKPLIHQAWFIDSHRVRIPFRIEIDELPAGMDSILLKGVIFTRPVTESVHYRVDSIHAEFFSSDFITSAEEPLYLQKYHPNISVQPAPGSPAPCLNHSTSPLDVGVFNKYRTRRMEHANCILNCVVTIDDILRADNPNNQTISSIPVISQIYQAVVYVQNDQGNLIALASGCTSDTAWINPDSLFYNIHISGEGYNLDLVNLTEVTYELGGDRSELLQDGSGMGFAFPLAPQRSYEVSPSKGMDSIAAAALDVIDLYMLAQYMSGNLAFSPYQIIAADINRDQNILRSDYRLLESLISGSISTFPGDRAWAFLPHDHTFSNPLNPFPFPSKRLYPSPQTLNGEDFYGLQLGDFDYSWQKPNKHGASREMELAMTNQQAVPGSIIEVPILSQERTRAGAFQFSLSWNPNVLEYAGSSSEVDGFRMIHSAQFPGRLDILWVCPDGGSHFYMKHAEAFVLRFRVIGKVGGSSEIRLASQGFVPKGCDQDLRLFDLKLPPARITIKADISSQISAFQEQLNLSIAPQPATDLSRISFFLPLAAEVSLRLTDSQGSLVARYQAKQKAGKQSLEFKTCFPRIDQIAEGLYFLQVRAGELSSTRKVIIHP